jgi:hypothetical protein
VRPGRGRPLLRNHRHDASSHGDRDDTAACLDHVDDADDTDGADLAQPCM